MSPLDVPIRGTHPSHWLTLNLRPQLNFPLAGGHYVEKQDLTEHTLVYTQVTWDLVLMYSWILSH